jgi:hypothetical protein
MAKTIGDLAVLVRSSNADRLWRTFEIMFNDVAVYERVRDSHVINREDVARTFGCDSKEVKVVNYDAALAIKVRFPMPQASKSRFDSDVDGGQQYALLLDVQIPE